MRPNPYPWGYRAPNRERRPNPRPTRLAIKRDPPLQTPPPARARALHSPRSNLALIAELWRARGGEGLPPLAGGSPLRGPETATGGSAGVGAQTGLPTGIAPRRALPLQTLQSTPYDTLPCLKRDFGARGDNFSDDTAAINAAINAAWNEGSAGPNGATIFAEPGVYLHEGEVSAFKEKTGVHILGTGAQVGGGGIGVGAPVGSTVFIYSGKGPRAWDFRSSVGCDLRESHCFAAGAGFTGFIWDLSGTEVKPSAFGHFVNSRVEGTRPTPASEIVACIGTNLDFGNSHEFDCCTFSSCATGVEGLTNAAHSSVGHRFVACFGAGNQVTHWANPQEAWMFDSCVAESLFNRKGEILNKSAFITYNLAITSHGITALGCWAGSNVPAARAGVGIEARGDGWVILGGSYNTCEVGVLFFGGAVGSICAGVRLWKVNSGINTATGKITDSLIAFNRGTEVLELLTEEAGKVRKGSIVQTANEAALSVT